MGAPPRGAAPGQERSTDGRVILDQVIEQCKLAPDEFVKGNPEPMQGMFSLEKMSATGLVSPENKSRSAAPALTVTGEELFPSRSQGTLMCPRSGCAWAPVRPRRPQR